MAAFENLSCLQCHHKQPILALTETTTKLVRQINSFCRIRQWRPLKICHVYNVIMSTPSLLVQRLPQNVHEKLIHSVVFVNSSLRKSLVAAISPRVPHPRSYRDYHKICTENSLPLSYLPMAANENLSWLQYIPSPILQRVPQNLSEEFLLSYQLKPSTTRKTRRGCNVTLNTPPRCCKDCFKIRTNLSCPLTAAGACKEHLSRLHCP